MNNNFVIPIETTTYHVVDYKDIDKLLRKTYNKEDLTCFDYTIDNNGSYKTAFIDPSFDDDMEEELSIWLDNPESDEVWTGWETAMCDLCRRGLIPSGDYLISIFW